MTEIAHHPLPVRHDVPHQRRVAGEQERIERRLAVARGEQRRCVDRARSDRRALSRCRLRSRRCSRPPRARRRTAHRSTTFRRRYGSIRTRRCCDDASSGAARIRASAIPRPATPKCGCPNRCAIAPPRLRNAFSGNTPSPRLASVVGHKTGDRAASARCRAVRRRSRAWRARGTSAHRPARDRAAIRPAARCAPPGNPALRRSARRHGCGSAACSSGCSASTRRIASSGTARSECSAMPMRNACIFHFAQFFQQREITVDVEWPKRFCRSDSARPSKPPVMYSVGSSVSPMPVSRAASISASDIAAGSAYGWPFGLMMQIVEFADVRVAGLEHLDVKLRGDRAQRIRIDAAGERVHRLAPGPERIVRIGLPFGEAGHRALERVRMHVRHRRAARIGRGIRHRRARRRRSRARWRPRRRRRCARSLPSRAAARRCLQRSRASRESEVSGGRQYASARRRSSA